MVVWSGDFPSFIVFENRLICRLRCMQVASKTLRTSAVLMDVSMNSASSLHPYASIIFSLFEETAYFILLVIDRFR